MPARVRPGRPDDARAIAAFTTDTFSWGDYVANEFPEWLEEPDSALPVATDDDDVAVALARVRMLSPREGWLSAARVHPQHRRQGLGSALNRWAVDWVQERGGRVCRLQIETDNVAAHNQVVGLGYRPVLSAAVYERLTRPAPDSNGSPLRPAPERLVRAARAESDLAYITWSTSDLGRRARGMFAIEPWAWRVLAEADLRTGPLWACPSGWALAETDEDGLVVRWMACTADDIERLLQAIIDLAREQEARAVQLVLPVVDWVAEALRRFGFAATYPTRIYEKPLT